MADVSTEIKLIEHATKGADIRTAIHDSIQRINEELNEAILVGNELLAQLASLS